MAASGYVVYNKDAWVDDVNNDAVLIDTMEYCGMPIASSFGDGSFWNLNTLFNGPLVETEYSGPERKDSSWSKFWLLQQFFAVSKRKLNRYIIV